MYEDSETNIAVFDAQCNDPDLEVRLNAMKRLSVLATALGVQRTTNELLPYLDALTESIYNDDEVLLILAEQLGNFLQLIGGTKNALLIINLLEKLASIEENLVRNKATDSLKKIASQLNQDDLEQFLAPLILRLATADWFTSKIASVSLFPICYERSSEDIKNELRDIYRVLCQDDSPLVRRASASKFNDFAKVLEVEWLLNKFVPVFKTFSKDDQDSVRVFAVDVGISIAERLSPEEIEHFVILTLTELSGDPSWRVRYQTAYQINALQLVLGRDLTQKFLISIYQNLIHDTEPQVREASAKNIVRFCEILHNTYMETEEKPKEITDPCIITKMIPLIHDLNDDNSSDVKEALATVLASLCSVLGEENTRSLLLPIITESLNNDSFRVQANIISNLNSIISIIGFTDIIDTVLNIITNLLNTSNSVWRTRRNLLVTISYMAICTGKEYFDEHLMQLYKKLLSDGVYAVRITAPLILPILTKKFGMQWAVDSLIPIITKFSNNKHYLYRYVALFCIDELIAPTLSIRGEDASGFTYLGYLCKCMVEGESNEFQDKIRLLITRLSVLNKNLNKLLQQDWLQHSLKILEDNFITDDDIKKYAEDTIDMFIKDNQIDILNISEDEVTQEGDEVYLEGTLYLSIYQFLPMLKKLAHDPVLNVQLKTAKSIIKIQNFNNLLQSELTEIYLKGVEETNASQECLKSTKYEIKELQNNDTPCIASDKCVGGSNSGDNTSELSTEFLQIFEEKLHADQP